MGGRSEAGGRELPPGVDFRRNQLTLDEMVHRMVTHCLAPSHLRDWETTEFVLQLMTDVLLYGGDDEKELKEKHCEDLVEATSLDTTTKYKKKKGARYCRSNSVARFRKSSQSCW